MLRLLCFSKAVVDISPTAGDTGPKVIMAKHMTVTK